MKRAGGLKPARVTGPATQETASAGQAGSWLPGLVKSRAAGMGVPLVLCLMFIVFAALSPHVFFTATNIQVLIAGQSTVLLLALAATIVLRTGDFDLSLSATMILSACAVGVLTKDGWPLPAVCLAALAIGLAVGLINAFFVVFVNIDGLIVTLGMLTILTGIAGGLTANNLVTTVPESLQRFASRDWLALPLPVWIGWILAAIVWYVFEFTPAGRWMLFIGGNRSASGLAGIRVARMRCLAFVASGLLCALAGILLAGILGSVDPTSGGGYLLPPFTAAFLGASAIQLGRFNVIGTLTGLYLLAVGIAGLQLIGLSNWIADVFNGGCLILAITAARLLRRRSR